ncbi:thioredoxin family protein [Piscinibacter sp.]|uniref:thioredoxin family protein n=1 Tax=Piscinibacter sp. TaxID=1903157 RepID=UPI002BEFBC6C|nr:thioredoxin family protein [Albitalea sp.]HUG25539.1 thioredoxin family protein [Albitalea sp.]
MKVSLSLIAAATLVAACSKPVESPPATAAAPAAAHPDVAGIAWKHAASDADVDAAFAQAKAENKPVFVYWGAKWCPPCNQVKATLFNRVDFIERSRAFVPVYIDGDSPGAQKLGTRFAVRGYPTMVLFNADGAELTRLPGEVDAAQYTQVLTLGMNAQRPVKAVLAEARRGGAGLTPNDWKLLAFYSWETDEQRVVPKDQTAVVLEELAATCPTDQPDAATRLLLKSVAARSEKSAEKGAEKGGHDAAARDRVLAVLADPDASRIHMDVLTNYAADIAAVLTAAGTPERRRLVDAFEVSLKRLEADSTLSRADRLTALLARVELAKAEPSAGGKVEPVLPEALRAEVRQHAARADREITDGYERQAVITAAAYMLRQAGLLDDSDALLTANLAKSHSPYYLMSALASNAKQRGDVEAALRWSQQAFDTSEGPATRLQWGAAYVNTLVDLAPQDEARIERAAQQLFDEAAAQPNAFYERSARSLQRVGSKLLAWNQGKKHAAVLQRLQGRLDGVCGQLPADDVQRSVCEGLLKA